MTISYNKLWELLVDKKMSASELRKNTEITPNMMIRMGKIKMFLCLDQDVFVIVLNVILETLLSTFMTVNNSNGNK